MAEFLLLKPLHKPQKSIKNLFTEKGKVNYSEVPENIFYDPSKLLNAIGYKDILKRAPFKFIRTAGSVWEFYLLQYARPEKREYKYLIKPIKDNEPIKGCRRTKLGNPYIQWKINYPEIDDNIILKKETQVFANKLVSRKCPIRQKGTPDFLIKRKKAAKSFFEYLIAGAINQNFYRKLKFKGTDDLLTKFITRYPDNDLFIVSGLMTCLYGGKNKDWVDTRLAKAVIKSMKLKNTSSEIVRKICNEIKIKENKFKPPFKDIYDNRERVNKNFRILTWLKLLEDTLNAH